MTDFSSLLRILSEADVEVLRVKRAAGRPKDFEAIAELEGLLAFRGE